MIDFEAESPNNDKKIDFKRIAFSLSSEFDSKTPRPAFQRDIDIDSDDLSQQIQKYEIEQRHNENHRYAQDTRNKSWLGKWAAWTVSIWLSFVCVAVLFNEILLFCIDTTVLITLLGTTTLNILGLAFIVLKGYFHNSK